MAQPYARLGVMRLGASRLDHYQPWFKVHINGVDRTANTRIEGASITQILNHEPDTAQLRVSGFTPTKGQELKIYMGDEDVAHQLFGGRILDLRITYEDLVTNVVYDLNAIDYTWLLNRRKVTKQYTATSATSIVVDLMSTFTAGFTTRNVVAGLDVLDEITFTNEDVGDALSRIAERIGGYWYVDYTKDLHFFLTESEAAGSITDASPRTASDVVQSVDLSQVITRVLAEGGGSVTLAECAAGETTIPVEDASWYNASGGTVQCGPQRITYTGVAGATEGGSTTGFVEPPPAPTVYAGTGGSLPQTIWLVALTWITAQGETTIGPYSSISLTGANHQIHVDPLPAPTDPAVREVGVYLSGSFIDFKLYTRVGIDNPNYFAIIITTTSGPAPPTANTAGATEVAAGSTSLTVADLTPFPAAGWAEAPGGQVIRYTGRSASSGAGTLTGIPASGVGSLTAPIRDGGTIRALPHLTGIPSSGAGSILYAINKGDQVNLFVTRNDTGAQTAMAGFVGGDGIHEEFITDGRMSETEITARGDALLAERKDPISTVTFQSRDQTLKVGRTVTFALTNPAVSGTLKIQRVTLTELAISGGNNRIFPLRSVDASSKRFSFDDLLRQIRGAARA